ncbi:hypothetical protein BU16DRAFT_527887 [Lophium mytilinum]|uniref:Uncharacterized protein n=1 Tax=Lophium mytilinum TaxID=390894 RepID=A0A6A6QS32_9PEZI|nr:hypothetical protein BU16DRAFT_527887 [Lophium mytilinum]
MRTRLISARVAGWALPSLPTQLQFPHPIIPRFLLPESQSEYDEHHPHEPDLQACEIRLPKSEIVALPAAPP